MTYTPPEGVTIGSFTAGTLPASFRAPADAAVTYKIYGTSAGAGVNTENLWDGEYSAVGIFKANGDIGTNADYRVSDYVEIEGAITYSLTSDIAMPTRTMYPVVWYNENKSVLRTASVESIPGNGKYDFSYEAVPNAKYVRFNYRVSDTDIMLTSGSTAPASYIPYGYQIPLTVTRGEQSQDIAIYIGSTNLGESEYVDYESGKIYKLQEGELTPTDPPVSLPSITASGETTITTTESLGDVELTGDWTAIMGSTQAESIDIGFTVDAEEYIAFVTVDDGPSIQVSDTITMPSSADSFSLEVVAWGREQYTDTVYNALS